MFGKSGSIVIRSLIGCQRRSFGYRFQNGLPICCERPEYRCINETSQRRYSKLTGDNTRSYKGLIAAVTVGSFGLGLGLHMRQTLTEKAHCKQAEVNPAAVAGKRRPDLPTYRKADIEKHSNKTSGIWVTYKEGIYDITEFLEGHPGGDKILLAAGAGLEPFWELYAIHQSDSVYEILETLRIGNLHPDDMKAKPLEKADKNNPFANEPSRHPALRVNSAKPFNAEPPPQLLIDNFVTPNDLFFVRNHLPVPVVEEPKFKLELSGIGLRRPISFSVDKLKKKFKTHTISATVQCAGNRRSEMRKMKEVKGLNWGTTAISNAEWTGVKLADVLAYAGVPEEKVGHVIFQGADKDIEGLPYEASIPAETAFDPRKDVLLVFEMNGKPLSRDHGYPLRVVVPGTVGARQVKWVNRIILSELESQSHWQQKDYKTFSPSTDWSNADFDKAIPIQEYPVQSVICEPTEGTSISRDDSELTVKGYAWSGGGRGIVRVDVSVDGGQSWQEASLHSTPQPRHRQWAWTLWEASLPIPEDSKELGILCKATDTSHNCQPETAAGIWNLRGLIHNAWHKVTVPVE